MTEAATTTQMSRQSSSQQSQSPSGDQALSGGSQTTQTQQAASRPDYVLESHWDAATGTVKPEYTSAVTEAFQIAEKHKARIASRPEKSEGYELKFPDGYTPPVAMEFKPDDPRVGLLRDFAHKNNWSQAEFSEALQIEAAKVGAENKSYNDAVAAETKKLGTNAAARITAVKSWLSGILGPDAAVDILGDDKKAGLMVFSAAAVEHFEKLQLAFTTQGGSTLTGNGREQSSPAPKPLAERWYGDSTAQRKVS